MTLINETYVTTGLVRFSYVTLVEPRIPKGSDTAKYSLALLIPKSDKTTISELKAAQKNAYQRAVRELWGGKEPKIKSTIKDGDGTRDNGEPFGDEAKGHWVLNVSSKKKPLVVDRNRNPIDPEEVSSGDYGRVNINAFAYDREQRGVTFGLNNVQFIRKGEPLGGGISVDAAFGDSFEDEWEDDDDSEDFDFS